MNDMIFSNLFHDVQDIVEAGKSAAYQSVNAAMLMTYWKIGERIVQEEQNGNSRAAHRPMTFSSIWYSTTTF